MLITHLAQNHPLPDGNKRAAFLLMARFLEANGRRWMGEDVAVDASTQAATRLVDSFVSCVCFG